MQTVDYNWQALQEESQLPRERPIHKLENAEDIRLTMWHNNTRQQKIQWRERQVPFTAWIDRSYPQEPWREQENRLWEEIQADFVMQHAQDMSIKRNTARFETGERMQNLKTIEIVKQGIIQDVFLIVNGHYVYVGHIKKIKGGIQWLFKTGEAKLLKALV